MTAIRKRAASRAARQTWTYLLVGLAAAVLSCDKGVLDPGPSGVAKIELTPSEATIQVGTSLQITPRVTDGSGGVVQRPVVWDSENDAIATVDANGLVTGVGPGTTRVGANVEGMSAVLTISVTDRPVASVTITPSIASVSVRGSIDLVATTQDDQGTELPGREVRWSSGDTTIAVVNSGGRVTGVRAGNVTISAESEGKSDTAAVTVTAAPVGSVVISPAAVSLSTGQTTPLSAVARDPSGTVLGERQVNWTSTDDAVATVSSGGVVSGIAAGTAGIIATVEGVADTASVTVVAVPVSAVVVSPASSSVVVGGTVQLAATPVNAQGTALPGRTATWATGDPAVATVSNSGLVTAVSPGTVTITATSEGKTGAATVTVSNIPVASVTLTPPTASVMVGDSVRLTATARATGGAALQGRTITWQSSNNSVATVNSSGWVVGVGSGTANITATSEGKSAQSTVTVTRQPVATISIEPNVVTVTVGQTSQLVATLRDAKGNVLAGRTVTWSSNRPEDASVGASTGLVSGVSVGSATIVATSEGQSASAAVTVQAAPVNAVLVSPANPSLYVGQTKQLTVQVTDANGEPVSTVGTTWATANPAVATVSGSGLVTAVAPGTVDITASNAGKTGKATVTVRLVPVATVNVTPSPASVVVGRTVTLTAQPRDSAGGALSGREVTWSTNDPSIATVNGSGVVTGVAAGTAVITATSEGKSGSSAVTVQRAPVAQVVIGPETASLTVGETQQFSATLLDDDGGSIPLAGRTLFWDSSNDNVALVSSSGRVTGRAPGTARIIVASEGKADTATVTVVAVPVSSVSVTPPSASITVGETVDFNAQPRDAEGNALTGRAVTWASSNTDVATVNGNGLVTARGVGTATIAATSEGQSGSATLTVTAPPVASVVVSPSSATLTVGQSATLSADPQDAAGHSLEGRVVTWESSNNNVATVTGDGVVTAVAPGAATITARSEGRSGTATISVSQVPVASVRIVPATLGVNVGRTGQLVAEPLSGDGTVLSGRVVVWTSANESIATVDDNGVVTGVAAGTATIRATSEGKVGTASVTVTPVAVQSVTVAPTSADLVPGDTRQFEATTKDEAGNALAGRAVAWTSSDESVATVNPTTGLVTAGGAGSATITAASEGKSGTAAVTVTLPPVASVSVAPSPAEVVVGRSLQLEAQPRDESGNPLTGRSVSWRSSETDVATVDGNGRVSGVREGGATITATSEGRSGTASVTVQRAAVATLALAPNEATLVEGRDVELEATLRDDQGAVLSPDGRTIEWTSSDAGVATVNDKGRVRGQSPGTATITATSEGRSGTAAVTVTARPVSAVLVSPSPLSLAAGETQQLSATPVDDRGGELAGRPVSWTSENEGVATVSGSGEVTAVSPGTTRIVATSESASGAAEVTVSPPPVSSVALLPSSATILVGGTVQLLAVPLAANGTELTGRAVGWRTSDDAVARVNGGLVSGVAEGEATITATSEGRSGAAPVSVRGPPAATVELSPKKVKLKIGEARQLKIAVFDAGGRELRNKRVEWRSGDDTVARVSGGGVVTAVGRGEASMTATVDGVSDSAQVEVND